MTSSTRPKGLCAAAAGALLALLVPAAARAQGRPPPKDSPDVRLDAEAGFVGMLDTGALNRALVRAGYSALSPVGAIFGGKFALEYRRLYFSAGLFGTAIPTASSTLSQTLGLFDFGYRILGSPRSWEIIPVVGLGVGTTTLTVGQLPGGAPSFTKALQSKSLAELQATSMLVHTGVLFDLIRSYNVRDHRGVALGASVGFVASPYASAWSLSSASATGAATSAGPHVPGTGVYGPMSGTLSF